METRSIEERAWASPRRGTFERVALDWSSFPPIHRGEARTIEVALAWGETVLEVRHLAPGARLLCGSEGVADLVLPESATGETFELLSVDALGTVLVGVPAGVRGIYRLAEGAELSLGEVPSPASGSTSTVGARSVPLVEGALVRLELSELTVTVSSFRSERALPRGPLGGFERATVGYFALSFSLFGSLLASLAYFVPPLGFLDEAEIRSERLVDLSHYLHALSERERRREETLVSKEVGSAPSGGNTAASPGAAGALGSSKPRMVSGRAAFRGTKTEATELARGAAIDEARHFGMNALLAAGFEGAVFERDRSLSTDDRTALGDLFSTSLGEVAGSGLALHGLDEGGGARGPSVGLTSVFSGNVLGTNCAGNVPCGGGLGEFGRSVGRTGGGHVPRSPRVTPVGALELSGRLPAEVIRRTVRQNFGRFRFCYERGLAQNPSIEGRVALRFVIGRDGAVSNVGTASNELGAAVGSCLVESFYGLSFPPPEGGIVTVTYPLLFSPE